MIASAAPTAPGLTLLVLTLALLACAVMGVVGRRIDRSRPSEGSREA